MVFFRRADHRSSNEFCMSGAQEDLEGYEFENGTATKLVKITRELNLINVLQNIYALGDTCSYVMDGDFLAPVAFVNSVCFKRK